MRRNRSEPRQRPTGRLALWIDLTARKCFPAALTPAVVSVRSRIGRRRPGRMQVALDNMRFVLGDGVPAAELDRVAAAHLLNGSWRRETRSRPSLINRQQVVGADHLRAALEEGRGCLVNFVHHGDYVGAFASLTRAGFPSTAVATSDMFAPDAPTWLKAHTRAVTSVPGTIALDVAGGSTAVRAQFAEGRVVGVAIDPAGHTPTRLFGKDLMLSSGAIRIAVDLGVPVVALTSRRPEKPWRAATIVLSAPFYPRDYTSPEQLHASVTRHLEEAVLEWPEAMDTPVSLTSTDRIAPPRTYRASA